MLRVIFFSDLSAAIFQAGPGKIGTELLMEPQHGHVWVERQQEAGGGHGGGSFWMSDKVCRKTFLRHFFR